MRLATSKKERSPRKGKETKERERKERQFPDSQSKRSKESKERTKANKNTSRERERAESPGGQSNPAVRPAVRRSPGVNDGGGVNEPAKVKCLTVGRE